MFIGRGYVYQYFLRTARRSIRHPDVSNYVRQPFLFLYILKRDVFILQKTYQPPGHIRGGRQINAVLGRRQY